MIISLEDALFNIFTNGRYRNLKPDTWAVCEALNRVLLSTKPLIEWEVKKARNEHQCSRGCTIKPGEKYYSSGKRPDEKLCSKCEVRLWRDDTRWCLWRIRNANKEHECARGCTIRAGDAYFIWSGDSSNDGLKLCVICMAMILFFKNVDKLTGYRYSAWDSGHKEPVRIERREIYSRMLPSMWPLDRV